jgi:conjugal transfer pilus assembly protein TraW
VKPILVAGEPLALTRQWKRQVYFDQSGHLVTRFGIKQVPALVSQVVAQRRLRIDEMKAD